MPTGARQATTTSETLLGDSTRLRVDALIAGSSRNGAGRWLIDRRLIAPDLRSAASAAERGRFR